MRKNNIRQLWSVNEPVLNGWITYDNSYLAETIGNAGFNSVTIDMQHGMIDYTGASLMLTALSTTNSVPFCRVPWNEPGIIMKMLDAGAYGIICPMINTVDEANKLVNYTRYPPFGQRSFGTCRAKYYGGSDYAEYANDTIIVLAMIETKEAIENVDEIAKIEGIDGFYIGPNDLLLSLGLPRKFDSEHPEFIDAITCILNAAKNNGKYAGIHCGSVEYAKKRVEQGFKFVTVGTDSRMVADGANQIISKFYT